MICIGITKFSESMLKFSPNFGKTAAKLIFYKVSQFFFVLNIVFNSTFIITVTMIIMIFL